MPKTHCVPSWSNVSTTASAPVNFPETQPAGAASPARLLPAGTMIGREAMAWAVTVLRRSRRESEKLMEHPCKVEDRWPVGRIGNPSHLAGFPFQPDRLGCAA